MVSAWWNDLVEKSSYFMPHGHCYLWIPAILWMHVVSDVLIGIAYVAISISLTILVRKIRLPFSPVFVAFGLFIGLCGLTHFLGVWTVWYPDYLLDALVKAATALASVATAIGLILVRPNIEAFAAAARQSESRRVELEALNAELQHMYEKVTRLSSMRAHFFATVSHELRTPLTLIMGPAARLAADPALSPRQREELDVVRRNAGALLRRVNDILDLARLESGELPVRRDSGDAAGFVRRVAAQFDALAAERRIDYAIEAPPALQAHIDFKLFERAIVNLLSNAFKFTPPGGRIAVRLELSGGKLALSVEDSGRGIAKEDQELIFEPFRQAGGAGAAQGTGLGLSIVRDIAALHGGEITVASEPGQGASFRLLIDAGLGAPAVSSNAGDMHEVGEAGGAAVEQVRDSLRDQAAPQFEQVEGRPAVLVAEDNADLAAFIGAILAPDYNVAIAANGREALARIAAAPPDMLVTDVMMPEMDGAALVRAVRAQPELNGMPILLLSANTGEELKVELLEAGAQDYVGKPFSAAELRARVNAQVRTARARQVLEQAVASSSGDIDTLAARLARKHRQLTAMASIADSARAHAEQASAAKTRFLAMVSHELRTPLATIQLGTQLLARQAAGVAGTDTTLARLTRATDKMKELVETLLEHSRIESGAVTVTRELCDVPALVRQVMETHQELVGDAVELQSHVDEIPELWTDPRLLELALNNLVANAIKFTERGVVRLDVRQEDGAHVFEVSDTGKGIGAADLARIFEPFEQAHQDASSQRKGFGLGLSIVHSLIKLLGGNIEVKSSERGSVFRIVLPHRAET